MSKPRIGLDFDGTLVDCARKQILCMQDVLGELELAMDGARYWQDKRRGHNNLSALRRQQLPDDLIKLANENWQQRIETDRYLRADQLLGDAREVLEQMSQRVAIVLISARTRPAGLRTQLQRLELDSYFECVEIVSPGAAAPRKAAAMQAHAIKVYIGDTESDQFDACAAGLPCILTATGQRAPEYLDKKTETPVMANLTEAWQAALALF